MRCPIARGLLMVKTAPGRYRLKVTREGVELFVREVNVPARAETSVVIRTEAAGEKEGAAPERK